MSIEEIILILEEWIKRDSKLQNADRLENIEIYNKSIKGLRSLKTWEKVKEDILTIQRDGNSFIYIPYLLENIINKHLQEVENGT